jgi:hypothetical protein
MNSEEIYKRLLVINTVTDTLKYGQGQDNIRRSIFSSEERFQQTIKTIESIKLKIPDAFIVLIEGSDFPIPTSLVDHVYKINDENVINIINGQNKSLGELSLVLNFLDSPEFEKIIIDHSFVTFNKISGRYFLTDNFDFMKYPSDVAVFKNNGKRMETRYYRIPMADFDLFKNRLVVGSTNPDLVNIAIDIETFNIFADLVKTHPVTSPDLLGVGGQIAVRNEFVEDFQENRV